MSLRPQAPSNLAALPPFTVFNDKAGTRIPLQGIVGLDGYGHAAIKLLFSDHEGLEVLAPMAVLFGYEENTENCPHIVRNEHIVYAYATTPVSSVVLKPNETVFNNHKHPEILQVLLANDTVRLTGRTVDQGFYKKLPIVELVKLVPPPPVIISHEFDATDWESLCLRCAAIAAKKCSACKSPYCGPACQRAHWPQHKPLCRIMADTALNAADAADCDGSAGTGAAGKVEE